MTASFAITTLWRRLSEPLPFDESDVVDDTELFVALRYFLSLYEGVFAIHIGKHLLQFDFCPDLSTIFEEVIEVLEQLHQGSVQTLELHFFEQGTDLVWLLTRSDSAIDVRFKQGVCSRQTFDDLPKLNPIVVTLKDFFRAWTAFLRQILVAIVALEPHIVDSDTYRLYLSRIQVIEQSE